MFFNEYISNVIISQGLEYVVVNYLSIREGYYTQQQT